MTQQVAIPMRKRGPRTEYAVSQGSAREPNGNVLSGPVNRPQQRDGARPRPRPEFKPAPRRDAPVAYSHDSLIAQHKGKQIVLHFFDGPATRRVTLVDFDKYALVVRDANGATTLVFKHGIVAISFPAQGEAAE